LIPVVARRTDVHLAKGAAKRAERWRRIAREASEQSRRASIPEIADPLKLHDFLAAEKSQNRIVLSENESDIQLRDVVESDANIAMAIGPEGGWTIEELHLFGDFAWKAASLGRTILRAETAAITALAIAQSLS
jgi:16S rRNA (uracil1498-N3)-methyltransferase